MKARRRRLFLPPGVISLSILPFLCFCVFYQTELIRLSQHVLEVTHWDERHTAFDPRRLVNDKFIKIALTGEGDAVKLEYFRDAVKQLLQKKDTTTGVEIALGSGARYASLVKLYDICEREGAHRYLHLKDKFWVFSLDPALEEKPPFRCGTRSPEPVNFSHGPDLQSFIKDNPWMVSISIIAFILLVGLASDLRGYFQTTNN